MCMCIMFLEEGWVRLCGMFRERSRDSGGGRGEGESGQQNQETKLYCAVDLYKECMGY